MLNKIKISNLSCYIFSLIVIANGAAKYNEVKIPSDSGVPVRYFLHNYRGPGTYKYGYDTGGDGISVPRSFKVEERNENGVVSGEYGYVNPYGVIKRYNYISDKYGYRVEENTGQDIDYNKIPDFGGVLIKTTKKTFTTRKPFTTRKTTEKTVVTEAPTTKTTTTELIQNSIVTKGPTTTTVTPGSTKTLEPSSTTSVPVSVWRPPKNPLIIGPIPRPFFPPLDRR